MHQAIRSRRPTSRSTSNHSPELSPVRSESETERHMESDGDSKDEENEWVHLDNSGIPEAGHRIEDAGTSLRTPDTSDTEGNTESGQVTSPVEATPAMELIFPKLSMDEQTSQKMKSTAGEPVKLLTLDDFEVLMASVSRHREDLQVTNQKFNEERKQLAGFRQALKQQTEEQFAQQEKKLSITERALEDVRLSIVKERSDLEQKLKIFNEEFKHLVQDAVDSINENTREASATVVKEARAGTASQLEELVAKLTAEQEVITVAFDKKLEDQSNDLELALKHERSSREHEQIRFREQIQEQRKKDQHTTQIKFARAANKQKESSAELVAIDARITAEIESLKNEMSERFSGLVTIVERSLKELERIDTESSQRSKDMRHLEALLKEAEKTRSAENLAMSAKVKTLEEQVVQLQTAALLEHESRTAIQRSGTGDRTLPETPRQGRTSSNRSTPQSSRADPETPRQPRTSNNRTAAPRRPRLPKDQHDWYHNLTYHNDCEWCERELAFST